MTGPDDSRRPTSVRADAVGDADRRAEHPDRRRDGQRPAASRARPSSRHESPRLVVIGGSAGGVEALLRVARTLPPGFPAPIVVVIHIAPTATSRLPEILTRTGPLPAQHVVEGDRLRPGVVSIAPPDRHVVVSDGTLSLIEGPRENGVRPAIDPLFRSAARSYGSGLIAAVLSGTLDDGTAGLAAVHANGGVTIAQEPSDAICPGMPTNAIDGAQVDYVARADEIGGLLDELVHRPAAESRSGRTSDLGGSKASDLVCPECGGVLREFDENGLARFHCRVGHNYSPEALFGAYDTRIEAAMWTAIRALEESASMARRLAFAANARGATQAARRFDDRERDAAERADLIRSGIMTLIGLDENPSIAEAEPVATEDERDRDEIREDALRIDAAS